MLQRVLRNRAMKTRGKEVHARSLRAGPRARLGRRGPSLLLGLAVMVALASGCATTRSSYVSKQALRGEWIDASFVASSVEWRFLFPNTPDCAAVLRPDAPVTYSPGGLWGRFVAPDGTVCEPVGIGNLERWRRTRPTGEPLPSSRAQWEIVHRDDEVLLLRGRFALASLVGLAGSYDLIAMVADDETCRSVAESGNATLVYRPAGRNAFMLSRCPVLAFAQP